MLPVKRQKIHRMEVRTSKLKLSPRTVTRLKSSILRCPCRRTGPRHRFPLLRKPTGLLTLTYLRARILPIRLLLYLINTRERLTRIKCLFLITLSTLRFALLRLFTRIGLPMFAVDQVFLRLKLRPMSRLMYDMATQMSSLRNQQIRPSKNTHPVQRMRKRYMAP